jgi:hypothetical protein
LVWSDPEDLDANVDNFEGSYWNCRVHFRTTVAHSGAVEPFLTRVKYYIFKLKAAVRLLTDMNSQMSLQATSLCKQLGTLKTAIRGFSHMHLDLIHPRLDG